MKPGNLNETDSLIKGFYKAHFKYITNRNEWGTADTALRDYLLNLAKELEEDKGKEIYVNFYLYYHELRGTRIPKENMTVDLRLPKDDKRGRDMCNRWIENSFLNPDQCKRIIKDPDIAGKKYTFSQIQQLIDAVNASLTCGDPRLDPLPNDEIAIQEDFLPDLVVQSWTKTRYRMLFEVLIEHILDNIRTINPNFNELDNRWYENILKDLFPLFTLRNKKDMNKVIWSREITEIAQLYSYGAVESHQIYRKDVEQKRKVHKYIVDENHGIEIWIPERVRNLMKQATKTRLNLVLEDRRIGRMRNYHCNAKVDYLTLYDANYLTFLFLKLQEEDGGSKMSDFNYFDIKKVLEHYECIREEKQQAESAMLSETEEEIEGEVKPDRSILNIIFEKMGEERSIEESFIRINQLVEAFEGRQYYRNKLPIFRKSTPNSFLVYIDKKHQVDEKLKGFCIKNSGGHIVEHEFIRIPSSIKDATAFILKLVKKNNEIADDLLFFADPILCEGGTQTILLYQPETQIQSIKETLKRFILNIAISTVYVSSAQKPKERTISGRPEGRIQDYLIDLTYDKATELTNIECSVLTDQSVKRLIVLFHEKEEYIPIELEKTLADNHNKFTGKFNWAQDLISFGVEFQIVD